MCHHRRWLSRSISERTSEIRPQGRNEHHSPRNPGRGHRSRAALRYLARNPTRVQRSSSSWSMGKPRPPPPHGPVLLAGSTRIHPDVLGPHRSGCCCAIAPCQVCSKPNSDVAPRCRSQPTRIHLSRSSRSTYPASIKQHGSDQRLMPEASVACSRTQIRGQHRLTVRAGQQNGQSAHSSRARLNVYGR